MEIPTLWEQPGDDKSNRPSLSLEEELGLPPRGPIFYEPPVSSVGQEEYMEPLQYSSTHVADGHRGDSTQPDEFGGVPDSPTCRPRDPETFARPIPTTPPYQPEPDEPVETARYAEDVPEPKEVAEPDVTPQVPAIPVGDAPKKLKLRRKTPPTAPADSPRAPHILEEGGNGGSGRLAAAARARVFESLSGLHQRYSRYLVDPSETRPMKLTPYALLGALVTAWTTETDLPVLRTLDEAITSQPGTSSILGALAVTALYTLSEARNYPGEPLEVPISARIGRSVKHNLRHPFGARKVRAQKRVERQEIRRNHKAATHTLGSWATKSSETNLEQSTPEQ